MIFNIIILLLHNFDFPRKLERPGYTRLPWAGGFWTREDPFGSPHAVLHLYHSRMNPITHVVDVHETILRDARVDWLA